MVDVEDGTRCELMLDRASVTHYRERLRRLRRILDGMPPTKRVVFVMFELEQKSCAEIGEELGIPVGTVYSRLHSARRAFDASRRRHLARQEKV